MPGRIEWDNEEKTILLTIYEGNMVLEEYYRVTDETFEALSKVSHPVHTIMLRQNVHSVPATMSKVLQYANKKTPDNLGINVIVGANAMTKMIVRIGKVVAPKLAKEVYFADSLEDARKIIQDKLSEHSKK